MDFFRSVFADEPDSPKSENESEFSNNQPQSRSDPIIPLDQQNPNPNTTDGGAWSFGGFMKTLSTKSESVIEIYRRDLKEFSSGLKKEIEVAHGSLENVGHAIDEIGSSVLKGTAQIISQGKEAILASDHESDSSDNNERSIASQQSLNSKPYSRFDAQVRAIQGDASSYCEEPDDLDDYKNWKLGFVLEEKREEVESLLAENGAMESIYKRVVPNSVDEETFWCRYYYKLYKLKQAEDVRANLVKRAISTEEEDLSWDVDDDDEEEEEIKGESNDKKQVVNANEINQTVHTEPEQIIDVQMKEMSAQESKDDHKETSVQESKDEQKEISVQGSKDEQKEISVQESNVEKALSGENVPSKEVELEKSKEETVPKFDEKALSDGKGDKEGSSKDSDVSIISSQPSMQEEEDLGWDEIEDLSSIDEKKVNHSGSPSKVDLRKRLSAAEEEEDLSWDIEDDDEPIKA